MIRIAVVGDIGSGKTYVAKLFGFQFLMQTMRWLKFIKVTGQLMKS